MLPTKYISKKAIAFIILAMIWIFVLSWAWCIVSYNDIFGSIGRFFHVIMVSLIEAIAIIIPIYVLSWVFGFTGWFTYWCYQTFKAK